MIKKTGNRSQLFEDILSAKAHSECTMPTSLSIDPALKMRLNGSLDGALSRWNEGGRQGLE